jgi:hypothetical protein
VYTRCRMLKRMMGLNRGRCTVDALAGRAFCGRASLSHDAVQDEVTVDIRDGGKRVYSRAQEGLCGRENLIVDTAKDHTYL